MEWQAFAERQSARKFDAAIGAFQSTANPSGVREGWTIIASRKKGGRNYGAYENPIFDAALDSASTARDSASTERFYTRAYQTIIDDAPAVWLYEPKTVIGIQRRIRASGMIPGSWWAGLAGWSIPPKDRIQRDRDGVLH
jgi:peptide/nickel transport system substrate-binding protein